MRKIICCILSMTLCAMLFFTGCGNKKTESESPSAVAVQRAKAQREKNAAARKSVQKSKTKDVDSEIETETEKKSKVTTDEVPETEKETENNDNPQTIKATEETFDYVAMGNSITCNEISDLWWGDWGMAASSEDKDYVHIVSEWLSDQSAKPVTTTVLDLKKWELAAQRDDMLLEYEQYFNENTDLITIQTGENITEHKNTLGSDYPNLISVLQEKAPNAQILMLGEMLWPSEDIEAAKRSACEQYGITFVDMTEFLNGYETSYKSYIGAPVLGLDGKSYTIANEVVAAHPNDAGMACIAQQVISHISINN